MNNEEGKPNYYGHRDRMRKRFFEVGAENMRTAELLEIMLFYAIPRRDTAPIARDLLNKFGNIKAVLEATPSQLKEIDGVSDGVIAYLKMIKSLIIRYETDPIPVPKSIKTLDDACSIIKKKLHGLDDEVLYIFFLDKNLNYINCKKLSSDSRSEIRISRKDLFALINGTAAESCIIAHNHPNGFPMPSLNDTAFTHEVFKFLKEMGITLIDHLIFTEEKVVSILTLMLGIQRVSPKTKAVDVDFYKKFYGDEIKNVIFE